MLAGELLAFALKLDPGHKIADGAGRAAWAALSTHPLALTLVNPALAFAERVRVLGRGARC